MRIGQPGRLWPLTGPHVGSRAGPPGSWASSVTTRTASPAPRRARTMLPPAQSPASPARRRSCWPGSSATTGSPARCTGIGISHSFLTDWSGGTGLSYTGRTPGRTLTCGYGLGRTVRTLSIDLRIRRLGVRVPPSAPSSQALSPIGSGALANGLLTTGPSTAGIKRRRCAAPGPALPVPGSGLGRPRPARPRRPFRSTSADQAGLLGERGHERGPPSSANSLCGRSTSRPKALVTGSAPEPRAGLAS